MKKENKRGYEVILENPPSILIVGAIIGWVLCGFSGIKVFCDNWKDLLLVGIGLELVLMVMKKQKLD